MSSEVAELEREADALPDGWRSLRLGDVARLGGGTTPARGETGYWDGASVPWATPSDITSLPTGVSTIASTESMVSDRALAECSLPLNPPGTVLMTSRATIGFVAINSVPMATNQGFITFTTGRELDAAFLLQWLIAQRPNLVAAAGGSTFKELSRGTAKLLPIDIPPLDEQQRIAEVLRSVDEAIAAQRATVEQHHRLIDAIFEQWSNQPAPMIALGDLLDFKNGINFEKDQKGEEGILTLDVMNMFSADMTPTYDGAYRISKAVPADLLLQRADILFVRSSVKQQGVGWASLADGFCENTTFCGFIIRGRPKRDDVLSRYVVGVLRAPKYRQWLIQHSTRSALTNINQKTIASVEIPIPSLEQQKHLVDQYERLAVAASVASATLANLEGLRADVANDLLSGRVRVPA